MKDDDLASVVRELREIRTQMYEWKSALDDSLLKELKAIEKHLSYIESTAGWLLTTLEYLFLFLMAAFVIARVFHL